MSNPTEVMIELKCRNCGRRRKLLVSGEGYKRWLNLVPVEDALPDLDLLDRTFLTSGICRVCFEQLWGAK